MRQKSNGARQALTALNQETRKCEHILPHHQPAPIPNQFACTPEEHGKRECPRLILDSQRKMDDQRKAEKRNENAVCCYGGAVLVDAHVGGTVLGTGCRGAIFIWTVAYEAVWVVASIGHRE